MKEIKVEDKKTVSKNAQICPECNKKVYMLYEQRVDDHRKKRLYSCYHSEIVGREEKREGKEVKFPISEDGRDLYPFQKLGVKFVEDKALGRALILDEQGLGKTVQTYAWIKRNQKICLPVIIFCKSSTKQQWFMEGYRWLGAELLPWVVDNPREPLYKAPIWIISHDLARKMADKLIEAKPKSVIVDEVHHIKEMSTKRSFYIRRVANVADYRIGLSGTPIKNRGRELFAGLNMVRPDLFPSEEGFVSTWVGSYYDKYTGKHKEGGIRDIKRFMDYAKEVVIRRTREEVLPDLPMVDRQFQKVDMADENKKAYLKAYDEFKAVFLKNEDDDDKSPFKAYTNLLAYIARMRHITGIAKVDFAAEYVKDFLESSESKITVFLHHKIVARLLTQRLKESGIDVLLLTGSTTNKPKVQEEFNRKNGRRVLLASTLASGEGLNLQYQCNTCVMLERQWNAANEEQAEGRFTRPDAIHSEGNKVLSYYIVALGTIDEWLTNLIEEKRKVSNIDGTAGEVSEQNIVMQLAEMLLEKGRPRWKLPK